MATQPTQPFSPVPGIFDDALAAGSALSSPRSVGTPDAAGASQPFVLVPDGYRVHSLQDLLPRPMRRLGTLQAYDAASFITIVNDYKSSATRIYGNKRPPEKGSVPQETKLVAVFDDNAAEQPGWGGFTCAYHMQWSFEFRRWMEWNGKQVGQEQFAVFMEDRYLEVVSPDALTMLEISRSMQAARSANFKKAIHLESGSTQFAYEDTVDAQAGKNGELVVPETFTIAIPVFHGGVKYALNARLRFRLGDGRLALWYEFIEPHRVMEHAIDEVWDAVKEGTSIAVRNAAPPSP